MFEFFMNPTLVWLMVGAAAPIIIHLATRNRPRNTPFPAVRFILASHKRSFTQFKLKQILLLLLRMGALALFALVLARPWSKEESTETTVMRAKTTITAVFLLDNSASMGYRHEGKSSFDRAKEAALAAVDSFSEGESKVCLVLVGDKPNHVIRDFDHAADLGHLKEMIKSSEISASPTDCTAAVNEAVRMLSGVKGVGKSIFLFTDLAASAWPAPAKPGDDADDITFYIIDAGAQNPANAAVLSLETPSHATPGAEYEIKAMVDGASAAGKQVELVIDGERRNLTPIKSRHEEILFPPVSISGSGDHWGRVTIIGDSGLTVDDSRYFTIAEKPPVRVLLVNGEPSVNPRKDELLYLRRALNPPGIIGGRHFDVKEVRPEELANIEFDTSVVMLCNVNSLPGDVWNKLRNFVSAGGGLVVTVGDNVSKSGYETVDRGSAALLPCEIGGIVSPEEPTALEPGTLANPILAQFRGGRNGDLAAEKFRKYIQLTPNKESEVAIAFKDKSPALVLGRYRTGKIAVYASTCDQDWNSFPIQEGGAYVVLMSEIIKSLAGDSGAKASTYKVSEVLQLPKYTNPETIERINLIPVAGGSSEDVTKYLDRRSGLLNIPPMNYPGVFKLDVTRKDGRKETTLFGTNIASSESVLDRLKNEDEVKAMLPGRVVKMSKDHNQLLDYLARAEVISEYASHLAGIVLLVLLGEMFLSNHMRARTTTAIEAE